MSPHAMMILAFFLLLAGFVVPFLMMMQMLQSTFLLNFLAYVASMGGLILGVIGIALWRREDQY